MNILVLPIGQNLSHTLKMSLAPKVRMPDIMYACAEFLIDYALHIRNGCDLPEIEDYIPEYDLVIGADLSEVSYLLQAYSTHVLGELELNRIDNPYIVSATELNFTIANKKEYS